jgi:hypothetical protein
LVGRRCATCPTAAASYLKQSPARRDLGVCAKNLSSGVVVVKPAKDGM